MALAKDINDHMPDYVVRTIHPRPKPRRLAINGSRMLLLGLSYKRNSGDARESPAIAVAERLVALGAVISAADPHLDEGFVVAGVSRVKFTAEELGHADAVVVLTDHDAFDPVTVVDNASYVFDTRHWLSGGTANVEHL